MPNPSQKNLCQCQLYLNVLKTYLFVRSAIPRTICTSYSTLDSVYTLQYLTELEYSGVNRNKEQSGRMLGHLISKAPQLIRPYMQPILSVLIPKLKEPDQNLGVVISILTAVGDIALVCQLVLHSSFVWLLFVYFSPLLGIVKEGCIPEDWKSSMILPIYKGKGIQWSVDLTEELHC